MGAFSSFALSFSLISLTTGIFANFAQGFREVGGAVIWSWGVAVVGQFLVALVVADLARLYPLAGYGYQWSSRILNPRIGFAIGWLLTLQMLTGFPGVCNSLAAYLKSAGDGWLGDHGPLPFSVTALTVLVISVVTVIHLAGIRLAALINDLGVMAELVGFLVITVVLLFLFGFDRADGHAIVFDRTNHATGEVAGLKNFALSLLLGAWCLTGFEAAADLAEETRRPRSTIPRAIIWSELSSGLGGFLMLLGFILAVEDFGRTQASEMPLLLILENRFGVWGTVPTLLVVFVSIFACALASMAAATRLIFSLARDNMLPFSATLKLVHPRHKTPRNAILCVWFIAVAVVIGLEKLTLITSVSAVAGYLGYAGIVSAALARARAGSRQQLVGILALIWTLGVVAALTVPELDGGHLPAIATGVGALVGLALYVGWVRGRLARGVAGPPKATRS